MPSISTAVNRPAVPYQGTTITAEVEVTPESESASPARHVALCLDTSGSMTDEELGRARDGAEWIFGLLEPEDSIAIVAFDTDVERVLGPTRWGDVARDDALAAVDAVTAGGGTDIAAGLEAARNALEAMDDSSGGAETDVVRRLLVLTDGRDPDLTPADLGALAGEIDAAGVRIQAAGLGADYDENTVRALGKTGRGEWSHLDAPGEIESFFGEAVEEAGSVVATDVGLTFDLAPGVSVSDVYRARPQAQAVEPGTDGEGSPVVPLPDLVEGEPQRVVLKLDVPSRDDDGDGRESLADVTFSGPGVAVTDEIAVTYTGDQRTLAQNRQSVQLDHQDTVVRTSLGRGDLEAAERAVERMARTQGPDGDRVRAAERRTDRVAEGGRAERNLATKVSPTGEVGL